MDAPLGIGILGAGWITRAHGFAIRTLPFVAPLGRPVGIAMLAGRDRGRAEAARARARRRPDRDRLARGRRGSVGPCRGQPHGRRRPSRGDRGGPGARQAGPVREAARRRPVRGPRDGVGREGRRRPGRVRLQLPVHPGHAPRPRHRRRAARSVEIVQFRAVYIQDYAAGSSPLRPHNGSRAVTDYAHIVDFLRYLGCEAEAVQATTAKLTARRAGRRGRLRRGGRPARRGDRLARGVEGRPRLEGPAGRGGQRDRGLAVVGHGGSEPTPRVLCRRRGGGAAVGSGTCS